MNPPVGAVMFACLWVISLLSGGSAAAEPPLYMKVGDDVVLKPPEVSGPITSIRWNAGSDLAVEWDGTETELYRHFQQRGKLNTSTGELTITGLMRNDSGRYTPAIDTHLYEGIELVVISPVSVPTLSGSCDEEKTSCVLVCDGGTKDAEPLTYNWNLGNSSSTTSSTTNTVTVAQEDNSGIDQFSCELQNPVSIQTSKPIPNPFSTAAVSEGLRINAGLTVFVSLLAVVVMLVLFHRWKAGMWFFQKASMPWEADFWRKEREQTNAAESNGTTARFDKTPTDEETPMT